jgi:ActR/RegA family two-component response regulator
MSKMFFRQLTRRASPAGDAPQAVLLDDDLDHCISQVHQLADAGYSVVIVCDLAGALTVIERDAPCLAVFHRRENDEEGAARAARQAKALRPDLRIVKEIGSGDLALTVRT